MSSLASLVLAAVALLLVPLPPAIWPMRILRRITWLAIAAIHLACFAPDASAAGPITYTLNDYPALENGHHLSGHITTDGTTGVWTTNHITSWEFAITNSLGTVIVDVHSTDPGATIQSFTPTILASPSSLAVVSGPTGGGFILAQNPTGNANRVGYLPASDPQRFFGNAGGGAIIWNSEIPTGDTFVIAGAGSMVSAGLIPGSGPGLVRSRLLRRVERPRHRQPWSRCAERSGRALHRWRPLRHRWRVRQRFLYAQRRGLYQPN